MIPWSVRDGEISRRLATAIRKATRDAESPSDDWVRMSTMQMAVGMVMKDPSQIGRFLATCRSEISSDSVRFLEHLTTRPAFFMAFSAEEALGDDLYAIRDFASGETRLWYSTGFLELYKMKGASHFSLFLDNGECLQAVGILHYYRGFDGEDFHYFANVLRPQRYASGGLPGVIAELPEWFIALGCYAEVPPIVHDGERARCFSSTVEVNAFDPSRLAQSCEIEAAKGVHRCRLRGSVPPFHIADLYWEPKKRRLYLYTKDMADYTEIAVAVSDQARIPATPLWSCTQNMEMVASMLLHHDPPLLAYERRFSEAHEASPEAQAELDRINALIQEVNDTKNNGRVVSLQEAAARHGVAEQNLGEIQALFDRLDHAFDIELEGGLAGIPILSPSERMKMTERLGKVPFFRFHSESDTYRLFSEIAPRIEAFRSGGNKSRVVNVLTLLTLPDILEDIAYQEWQDEANTVLKYTLYLLCLKSGQFESTWDYASEILRLFWQVLIPRNTREYVRRFMRRYTIWCRDFLLRAGFVVENEQGAPGGSGRPGSAFEMRASPFLLQWLSLRSTKEDSRGK